MSRSLTGEGRGARKEQKRAAVFDGGGCKGKGGARGLREEGSEGCGVAGAARVSMVDLATAL
ncbi:hypothetical protein E2562_023621 [Oryza meyeriana var. granulata]|uniref:Uncharacterized protein n=1 Tax=Oryza meyeriana var. granulata TaxID=110450 RepID=A0A6G1FBH1_9ORYZ|nr:hypothetical protein E2562_023621 [Oryza meyeriana var. granulata]